MRDIEQELEQACLDADEGRLLAAERRLQTLLRAAPDDLRPRVELANVFLQMGQPQKALIHMDAALELVEEEDELIACVLQKADVLITLGSPADLEAARGVLGELATSVLEDDDRLAIADAYLGCGAPTEALHTLSGIANPTASADAALLAGLAHDQLGDAAARSAAWLTTRELDRAEPRPSWAADEKRVHELAASALAELTAQAQQKMATIPVLLDEAPNEGLIRDGVDPRVLGLFVGGTSSEQGSIAGPTSIHIYVRNIERVSETADEFAEQLRTTVIHETAHYFGLDDEALASLGLA